MKYSMGNFPVTEVPIKTEGLTNSTDYKFIVRCDTSQVLSCMTKEYKLVTNQEVIDASYNIMKEAKATMSEVRTFGGGARTVWKWKFPDSVEVKKGDFINPEILIKNSYDGSTQVSLLAGLWRQICSNGMVIGNTIGYNSNRHSIYNPNLDKLPEIIYDMVSFTKDVIQNELGYLISTELKNKNNISKVVEMFPQQVIEQLVNYLAAKEIKTYWDLLNACTWVTTHAMNRSQESTFKLESTIYPKIKKWANEEIAQA